MLTLFAVVGLSFVFYADSEATSSRVSREAETLRLPDVDAEQAFALFLSQLIFDVNDDTTGVLSGLRGHSLARLMYGLGPGTNTVPFNGVGRLHYQPTFPTINKQDDYLLINYTYFTADGFLRDPERFGFRANLSANPGAYVGGFNVPYTYPDLNNIFLAAVNADGKVLIPSFHRAWLFNPGIPLNDMTNPNWTNAIGKYLILRPRPIDHGKDANGNPLFPPPDDATGDVKNLVGSPGGNDSIWIDLGAPVMTLPDGRRFKALFAPLIMDLDNRLNVNYHGNVNYRDVATPPNPALIKHVSNHGMGPWEVSLQYALNKQVTGIYEWPNLFLKSSNPLRLGRYGLDNSPDSPGPAAPGNQPPYFYNRVDLDGCKEPDRSPSVQFTLPAANGWTPFPDYPITSYGHGNPFELLNHPLKYNPFSPSGDDRTFRASNMAALLRFGDTGSESLTSELMTLCRLNFADPTDPASARRRRLVTTHSFDPDRTGITPWYWNNPTAKYQLATGAPFPFGSSIQFPSSVLPNSPDSGEFGKDWRAGTDPANNLLLAFLLATGRLDLNRSLPDYPPQDATGRINLNNAQVQTQFQVAQLARQQLAQDIFTVLRSVTGAADPSTEPPGTPAYNALRWVAQLSVNIVDYIDTDDYITPFNWNPKYPTDNPSDPNNKGVTLGWVFGTELPRVVINEAYVQYTPVQNQYTAWLELHNPFNVEPNLRDGGVARLEMPESAPNAADNYPIYQLVISRQDPNLLSPTNVLGDWDKNKVYGTAPNIQFPDHWGVKPTDLQVSLLPANGSETGTDGKNEGYYLIGPKKNTQAVPFPTNGPNPPPPTATLSRTELAYTGKISDPPTQPTFLLRRLACPHFKEQSDPKLPFYNPFITVDYMENVKLNSSSTMPITARTSEGRNQPYAAHTSQKVLQNPKTALNNQPKHTFFRGNWPRKDPTTNQTFNSFDWLVHLDRQLISPMELLHVSGFKPHLLTRQFMTGARNNANNRFQHLAPWFDQPPFVPAGQTARLYRAFEFLETRNRSAGMMPGSVTITSQTAVTPPFPKTMTITPSAMSGIAPSGAPWSIMENTVLVVDTGANQENVRVLPNSVTATTFQATFLKAHAAGVPIFLTTVGDRLPGKININTVWDPEVFLGLCDPQNANFFNSNDAVEIYTKMLASRTPWLPNNKPPDGTDRPFRSLATGLYPANDTQFPGFSIENTVLRSFDVTSTTDPKRRLFQPAVTNPNDPTILNNHPYLRNQLLTKVFNNLTTRSNVFAVWVTVGFFEVVDDSTRPVKLGAEIGRAQGKQIRHRMFAIVDRTAFNPLLFTTKANNAVPAGPAPVVPAAMILPDALGNAWNFDVGDSLLVDTGANQEVVKVTAVTNNNFTAVFSKPHAAGFSISKIWGPQPRLNPHMVSGLIPYFSVID
jgi:hypothetical protein